MVEQTLGKKSHLSLSLDAKSGNIFQELTIVRKQIEFEQKRLLYQRPNFRSY